MAGSRKKKGKGEDFGELQARMTRAILTELRKDVEDLLVGLEAGSIDYVQALKALKIEFLEGPAGAQEKEEAAEEVGAHEFWRTHLTKKGRGVHAFWMRRASRILDEEKARSAGLGQDCGPDCSLAHSV